MIDLSNKIALVTGGSRGIGAATAKRLARQGASVAISYHSSADRANQVVQEIQRAGGKAIAMQANGSDPAANAQLIQQVVDQLGKLDILVNNAGVYITGGIAETDTSSYTQNFDLNVRGVYETTRAAVDHLNDNGRIINIGSAVAIRAFPGVSAYAGSKAAVAAFTRAWAKELGGRGITVNTLHPGSVNTEMNPADSEYADAQRAMNALGRFGTAEEIAATVAFLASDEAAFISGSEILVDGAMTA